MENTYTGNGKIIVLCGPSGAGKGIILEALLKRYSSQLSFSVSATTRPIKDGEVPGKNYHYLSEKEFKEKIAAGEFLEYEEVYPGRWYGTLMSDVKKLWSSGYVALFDVDVKGAHRIKQEFGERAITIFIHPGEPAEKIIRERLKKRGKESESDIEIRVNRVREEINHVKINDEFYDYTVYNENGSLVKTIQDLDMIVYSEVIFGFTT
jgi:guanylate kinase